MKRIRFLMPVVFLLIIFLIYVAIDNMQEENQLLSDYNQGTGSNQDKQEEPSRAESSAQEESSEKMSDNMESVKIKITVGDEELIAIPEKNSSAKAFVALLHEKPVTVKMHDYANMEKVGYLEDTLPRNDRQINVSAGDVILYQGNQITIYYDDNSWNLTKLAAVEDITKTRLLEVLGTGDVEVTFSLL